MRRYGALNPERRNTSQLYSETDAVETETENGCLVSEQRRESLRSRLWR